MITYQSLNFSDCFHFLIFLYSDNTQGGGGDGTGRDGHDNCREHQKLNCTKNDIMLGNSQASIKSKANYDVLPHIIWPQVHICFQIPGIYTHIYKQVFTLKWFGMGKKKLYYRIHCERCTSGSYISLKSGQSWLNASTDCKAVWIWSKSPFF